MNNLSNLDDPVESRVSESIRVVDSNFNDYDAYDKAFDIIKK